MPAYGFSAGSLIVSAEGSALGTQRCTYVQVQAVSGTLFVGSDVSQPWRLSAGSTLALRVSTLSAVLVKTSAGSATVNWLCDFRP